jgi:hypothetical protein
MFSEIKSAVPPGSDVSPPEAAEARTSIPFISRTNSVRALNSTQGNRIKRRRKHKLRRTFTLTIRGIVYPGDI